MSCIAFSSLLVVLDDVRTLSYKVQQDGVAVDITGWTFAFEVRDVPGGTVLLGPVAGAIDVAAEGEFSFEVTFSALIDIGVYEITRTVGGNKQALTPGNGVKIEVVDKIVT